MLLPEIVKELIIAGIPVTIKYEEGQVRFYLEGFYKENGSCYLRYIENDLVFCGRYSNSSEYEIIDELRDIVQINFYKWLNCRDRGVADWEQPNALWLPLMIKFELVKLKYQPKYDR